VIRIERAALPPGMNAFARRKDRTIVVYVARGLSASARRAAIREALGAAPLAGWRALRSPVLLPVLAGSTGLRRAPEGRWVTRALLAAAAVVVAAAIGVAAVALLSSEAAPHRSAGPATGLQPGAQPTAGSGTSATGTGPAHPTRAAAAHRGPASASGKSGAAAPVPETSGTAVTVPAAAAAPAPSGSSATAPATPSQVPSPAPTTSTGTCVDVLGLRICL
jgi:hypothetical protein